MSGNKPAYSIVTGLGTSLTRTLVPFLAGSIISVAATWRLPVSLGEDEQHVVEAGLSVLIGTVWYVLVRVLEARWPRLGVLLGAPRAPSYGQATRAKHVKIDVEHVD